MNATYVSALAALTGSVIGGFTSFATSWLVQESQTKAARKGQELNKREQVYGAFIDELSKRFAEAIEKEQGVISDVITLYSQISRMQLFAPTAVVDEARRLMALLNEAYRTPPKTFAQVQAEHGSDPLRQFGDLCRKDLETI